MSLTGELVSLVLVPRFTTYVGSGDFSSVQIDVSGFSGGTLMAWRGPLVGTTPHCVVYVEESEDGIIWTALDNADLTSASSDTLSFTLTRRWLRARVSLSAADTVVTCWCSGSIERRVA